MLDTMLDIILSIFDTILNLVIDETVGGFVSKKQIERYLSIEITYTNCIIITDFTGSS